MKYAVLFITTIVFLLVALTIHSFFFLTKSYDEELNDTISALDFINNLSPVEANEEDISSVEALALKHHHFSVRINAIDFLGVIGGHEIEIWLISQTDDHFSVARKAKNWLENYDEELLKYNLARDYTNPFGQTWILLKSANAVIAAIDNTDDYSVGLSATQIANLGLKGTSDETLAITSGYGTIDVVPYNAFGLYGIDGAGIRISNYVARDLDLKIGDTVLVANLALSRKPRA